MGSSLSRSVEIQISNKTQNITLKNLSTHCGLGRCSQPPLPELSPGSSDTCSFSGAPVLWGLVGTTAVKGILVYEAESFTLAIYFYNPIDHDQFSVELGLEVSPGMAHLDDPEATYSRMAKGTYSNSDQDIKFTRVTVAESHGSIQLSHGPIKLMATMSKATSSMIKVVLEEEKGSGEEAERQKPWDAERQEPWDAERQEPWDVERQKPRDVERQKPWDVKRQKPWDVEGEKPQDAERQKPWDVKRQKPRDAEGEKSGDVKGEKSGDVEGDMSRRKKNLQDVPQNLKKIRRSSWMD